MTPLPDTTVSQRTSCRHWIRKCTPTNATILAALGRHPYRPEEVTGDQVVAAMNSVGVDGAILVSPFSLYRYDASYALEVFARAPLRFRLVTPVDPTDAAIVDTIADWASTNGTVGIRIFFKFAD